MLDKDLITQAGFYGLRVSTAADDEKLLTRVQFPNGSRDYANPAIAVQDVQQWIERVDAAEREAQSLAATWQQYQRTDNDDQQAWERVARDVNKVLPEGCSITLNPSDGITRISSLPPMSQHVAVALAEWKHTTRRMQHNARLWTL